MVGLSFPVPAGRSLEENQSLLVREFSNVNKGAEASPGDLWSWPREGELRGVGGCWPCDSFIRWVQVALPN